MLHILWIIIILLFTILPHPFMKRYRKTKNYIWILMTMISYFAIMFIYTHIIHEEHIPTCDIYLRCITFGILVVDFYYEL